MITVTFRVYRRKVTVITWVGRSQESQRPESRLAPGMFRGGLVLALFAVVDVSDRTPVEDWCKAAKHVPSRAGPAALSPDLTQVAGLP
jgi:hypothetical protein